MSGALRRIEDADLEQIGQAPQAFGDRAKQQGLVAALEVLSCPHERGEPDDVAEAHAVELEGDRPCVLAGEQRLQADHRTQVNLAPQ
ncbi:MAG: hypothetical protein M0014_09285 [Actinomycetota bacterium]|nr:hypothetical protein [Actinomycetota bacterium]